MRDTRSVTSSRTLRWFSPWAALLSLLVFALPAGAASTISPLPASDYTVTSACPAPAAGEASCLALALLPKSTAARQHTHPLGMTITAAAQIKPLSASAGGYGFRPQDLQGAYFPGEAPEVPSSQQPQTVALVDAYDDLTAEADLRVYDEEFKLPACTTANGCFEKVNQEGNSEPAQMPFPTDEAALTQREKTCKRIALESRAQKAEREAACHEVEDAKDWALETATDIEVSHAVCQNCKILLVEADSDAYVDLERAEQAAAEHKATEISDSWGGEEPGSDSEVFNHPSTQAEPGIVITAAAGDDGYLNWDQYDTRNEKGSPYFPGPDYPASSPHVVAVGGTELTYNNGAWQNETVWNDASGASGGGCSRWFAAPSWQTQLSDWSAVGCGAYRSVSDVAADADPNTGVAVYDSTPYEQEKRAQVIGWIPIGGTSVASPIIASMFALAGGAPKLAPSSTEAEYPAQILYTHLKSSLLHEVLAGGNGECDDHYTSGCGGSLTSPLDCGLGVLICNAGEGYDGPTGVGTPKGIGAFKLESQPAGTSQEGSQKTKPIEEPIEEPKPESNTPPTPPVQEEVISHSQVNESTTNTSKTTVIFTNAAGSPPTSPSTPPASKPPAPTAQAPALSALTLSSDAVLALRRSDPLSSQIGFAFTLSESAQVNVGLYEQVHFGGRTHWRSVMRARTISAVRGRNRRALPTHTKLTAGRYMLKLIPSGGAGRSILFRVL